MARPKSPKKNGHNSNTSKRVNLYLIIVSAAIGVGVIGLVGYTLYYSSKVLPHVQAAGQSISGKSLPEAADILQTAGEQIAANPVTVVVDDKKLDVHALDFNLVIDGKATANLAYQIGRRSDLATSVQDYGQALIHTQVIPLQMTYDSDKLQQLVGHFADTVDIPEVNAGVKIENGKAIETNGTVGHRIDQDAVIAQIINRFQTGQVGDVDAVRHDVSPRVANGNTAQALAQAQALRSVKFVLSTGATSVSVKQATLDSWITSKFVSRGLAATFDTGAVQKWLDSVSSQFNSDPQEAKLTVDNGKVTVFSPGQNGQKIDSDKTVTSIVAAADDLVTTEKAPKSLTVTPTLIVTKPAITDQNIDSLGISDLIGSATTSFSTSPENRIHNITVGATALNGVLIKPGDEFSTLKYLGSIDGAAGYLPELVIKENRTVPDFGGGLCQVSTTLFRAIMASGLKVTERRNHSYRVGYYEPPVGKDATIFEGGPDLKFVNDTASNVLVQSHIDGLKLTFDFYGKSDGRTVNMTTPVVSDIVPPPAPIYEQTSTLPTGTTKQTEHAHNGANATFTYTVTNADGTVRTNQVFNSHYVPWQARYLVGTS